VEWVPFVAAAGSALGLMVVVVAAVRIRSRRRMRSRLQTLGVHEPERKRQVASLEPRLAVTDIGSFVTARLPTASRTVAASLDRTGLFGRFAAAELVGWKVIGVSIGLALGIAAVVQYGAPGLAMLAVTTLVGWFVVELILARYEAARRRRMLRDLPTVMDLLVLSLEAGMGLDRALRTVVHEYRSPLSDELRRVLSDVELGFGRGEAFTRMAVRVGLDDVDALSRAIVQTDELGVSLVGVMQTQSREVRLSRRRAAEAEAVRAPIKMLFPLVIFILPTLFMLLLGPVGLRTAAMLSGQP
jgi:tight adherence protein C